MTTGQSPNGYPRGGLRDCLFLARDSCLCLNPLVRLLFFSGMNLGSSAWKPIFPASNKLSLEPSQRSKRVIAWFQQLKMSANARSNNPESVAIRRDDSFGKRRGTPIE